MKLPEPPLLVITDRRQARGPLPDIMRAACEAGCRWFSIREKDLSPDEQIALARELVPIVRSFGARVMLHGEPRIAEVAGLDGFHLSAGSNAADARAALGPERLVGISGHSAAEAAKLDPTLVDYAIAGPAYETESKPGYGPALGAERIAEIVAAAAVPVLAIGGIRSDKIGDLARANVAGIAVMGSIMRADAPADEVKVIIATLKQTRPSGFALRHRARFDRTE